MAEMVWRHSTKHLGLFQYWAMISWKIHLGIRTFISSTEYGLLYSSGLWQKTPHIIGFPHPADLVNNFQAETLSPVVYAGTVELYQGIQIFQVVSSEDKDLFLPLSGGSGLCAGWYSLSLIPLSWLGKMVSHWCPQRPMQEIITRRGYACCRKQRWLLVCQQSDISH